MKVGVVVALIDDDVWTFNLFLIIRKYFFSALVLKDKVWVL